MSYQTKRNKKIMKNEKIIKVTPITLNTVTVRIEGDSDLILNKMDAITIRELLDERNGKGKKIAEKNDWETIITSMHWKDGEPKEYTETALTEALKTNAPCITAFGLKKSFEAAVVRNNIDKYATKFRDSVNVVSPGGLAPIQFAEHFVDEKLMSPKRGAPVRSLQNRFTGWSAEFKVQFVEGGAYSLEQIIQIIGLAGFGGGIGSGRTSGYGRYHIAEVKG